MTMISLMSAILVFSTQNSFQIAFKNLKASWRSHESYEIAGENYIINNCFPTRNLVSPQWFAEILL